MKKRFNKRLTAPAISFAIAIAVLFTSQAVFAISIDIDDDTTAKSLSVFERLEQAQLKAQFKKMLPGAADSTKAIFPATTKMARYDEATKETPAEKIKPDAETTATHDPAAIFTVHQKATAAHVFDDAVGTQEFRDIAAIWTVPKATISRLVTDQHPDDAFTVNSQDGIGLRRKKLAHRRSVDFAFLTAVPTNEIALALKQAIGIDVTDKFVLTPNNDKSDLTDFVHTATAASDVIIFMTHARSIGTDDVQFRIDGIAHGTSLVAKKDIMTTDDLVSTIQLRNSAYGYRGSPEFQAWLTRGLS